MNGMNRTNGTNRRMKRSLPCMDLMSMYSEVDQNPLKLRFMDNHKRVGGDQPSLADASSAKKRRIAPLVTDATPATQALDRLLHFVIVETDAPLPICDGSSSLNESESSAVPKSNSHMRKSKSNYCVPTMHNVTRGMALLAKHPIETCVHIPLAQELPTFRAYSQPADRRWLFLFERVCGINFLRVLPTHV